MTNKKLRNRILYISVAVLWGIAIYRTVRNNDGDGQEVVYGEITPSTGMVPAGFTKDTFELELPETDPFLAMSWKPEPAAQRPDQRTGGVERKKETPAPQPVQKSWPEIEYFGFVKNRDRNSTLCLLKIDQQIVQLSRGEQLNGLLVKHTYEDSVQVLFEGELKMVRK